MSAVALRLAGAILLAAAAPAAASEPVRAPADSNSAADAGGAKAAAKADDDEKTVCRRVPHTGTLIGWKRICKPKSEWRAGEG